MKNLIAYTLIKMGLYLNPKAFKSKGLEEAKERVSELEKAIAESNLRILDEVRSRYLLEKETERALLFGDYSSDNPMEEFNNGVFEQVQKEAFNKRFKPDTESSAVKEDGYTYQFTKTDKDGKVIILSDRMVYNRSYEGIIDDEEYINKLRDKPFTYEGIVYPMKPNTESSAVKNNHKYTGKPLNREQLNKLMRIKGEDIEDETLNFGVNLNDSDDEDE